MDNKTLTKSFGLALLAILAIALSRNEQIALAIQLSLGAGILIFVIHNEPALVSLINKLTQKESAS